MYLKPDIYWMMNGYWNDRDCVSNVIACPIVSTKPMIDDILRFGIALVFIYYTSDMLGMVYN